MKAKSHSFSFGDTVAVKGYEQTGMVTCASAPVVRVRLWVPNKVRGNHPISPWFSPKHVTLVESREARATRVRRSLWWKYGKGAR